MDLSAVQLVQDRMTGHTLNWVDSRPVHKLLEVDMHLNQHRLSIEDLAAVDRSAVMLEQSWGKGWHLEDTTVEEALLEEAVVVEEVQLIEEDHERIHLDLGTIGTDCNRKLIRMVEEEEDWRIDHKRCNRLVEEHHSRAIESSREIVRDVPGILEMEHCSPVDSSHLLVPAAAVEGAS